MNPRADLGFGLALVFALGCTACTLGPPYRRPEAPVPPAFKEADGWKVAEPNDQVSKGKWWELFGDTQLNALEERLTVSNNSLRAAQAQFEQARALVRTARAAQLPSVVAAGAAVATNASENKANVSKTPDYADYLVRADVAYELDVWGRVRQTVAASRAAAQAAAADVESVSLSLHAELALNYFALRALDAEQRFLDETVAAYERGVDLTVNRYKGGIASAVDVAQARTQLESTRTLAIDLRARRAQVEHAIAVLVGQPASTFSLTAAPLSGQPPGVPADLPSSLLERRPDIAAAERRVATANAQIGIAAAAFYPVIGLTASGGFESAALVDLVRLASNFWSAAPAAAVVLFDGGRRRAASDQARAVYDRTVAAYRETVLVGFREVEDNLVALRVLAAETRTQSAAVAAAERYLELSTNRYKGGVATYLEVINAQTAALSNRRAMLNILARRMTATVLLVKALGGGWHASTLPM
ncbi:MAG TPA: efflux transporter outer membrane subunit [Vicinamibacterales bacterium]